MDYGHFFSDDVASFMRSPVREIFKKVDLNAIFSFAGGYPNAATFPLEAMKSLSAKVLDKYGAKAMQYGATQGVPELRQAVARRCGVPVANVQITTSSQQGIDVCTRVLVNPGDVILTLAPTYLGALQSFKSYRADVRTITLPSEVSSAEEGGTADGELHSLRSFRPLPSYPASCPAELVSDGPLPLPLSGGGQAPGDGSTLSASPSVIARSGSDVAICPASPADSILRRAKFIYLIPDFQNPSGETMTLEQRQFVVDLARKYDILIVEDSPYRELRYSGEPVPTIYSLAPERTLHLGSFSKIFAPGFRLGWMLGPEELLDQVYVCKQSLDLCPPVFDQYLAAEYLESGELDLNLQRSIELYRGKRDHLLSLLEKYMPDGVSWTRPDGGLFLFLTLPEGMDTVAMYDRALSAGVAYVAGSFFYVDGSHRNTMRMNFSFLDTERMEEGVRILSNVIRESL